MHTNHRLSRRIAQDINPFPLRQNHNSTDVQPAARYQINILYYDVNSKIKN